MIVAEKLSKNFNDIQAVADISFTVKEGETMVLLGTSGCGKTTTLKMINRLIEATSGSISINGQDIFQQQPEILRRTIGYVSQNNGLFPHYTVSENIAVVPRLLGWDKVKIREHAEKLLDQLKLPVAEFGDKYPDELSGGQKQRVTVARALISDSPVLLMDEPFGALDPVTRAAVRKEFVNLPELKKKTIILVTHDVQEAFEMGDRICLMDKGRIVQSGDAKDLLFRPANDFVRSFFENQRLYLELTALKFEDIWHLLPVSDSMPDNVLESNQSLWQGMELLSQRNVKEIAIKNLQNGEVRIGTQSSIQTAFNQIKNNI
ncbi:ABC transporter ATP-binding protein [Dyadobacter arcticus]|uniref:Osmoprotectant transport system ATP-binding protein n=1 Tax=Dyadobacter arcticus TaxID=1078754 RepID=A0ABX0UQF3_9BACT|nr:ATP-binding cassette domain-containing protein [Dyadobacter arcticus]NIJ53910.1 osmoprotectant transport system ATP-binding protein [Dyadobacter arcticus]